MLSIIIQIILDFQNKINQYAKIKIQIAVKLKIQHRYSHNPFDPFIVNIFKYPMFLEMKK